MDIGLLLRTLFKLYAVLLLGFVLAKVRILDGHVNRSLSVMVVSVTYPAKLVCSVLGQPGDRGEMLLMMLGGLGIYLAVLVLSKGISRLLRVPEDRRREFECLMVFTNTGFIGAPLAQSLFGDAAFYQMTLMNFAYYVLYNTYGITALAPRDGGRVRLTAKDVLTPGFVMTVVAIVLFLLRADAPATVKEILAMVGDMTTPLSMIILGASLAAYPFKQSIGDPWTYVYSGVKLLVMPALAFGVTRLLGLSSYHSALTILTCSMPAGSMVLMLALKMNRDDAFISRSIFVSTLLSAITLPAVILLFVR
ncbi:MAG: AEC family transporter [Lachnospiraceae bacterium]|nr:AEC family transporter [Lachnospiraceae bacterium]